MRPHFLTQNIIPTPLIQLPQDFHRPELAIPDQQHRNPSGQQAVDITQQRQLPLRGTVSLDVAYPGPGNWDGAVAISQTDHQELVGGPHFGSIHNQAHLLKRTGLGLDPLLGDGFIPFPYLDSWIIQKPAQAAGQTGQFGCSWYFSRNSAQTDRTALMDPHQQPNEVANLGDTLGGTQFPNPSNLGMIEGVDRHTDTPWVKGFAKIHFTWDPMPINYFVVKSVRSLGNLYCWKLRAKGLPLRKIDHWSLLR